MPVVRTSSAAVAIAARRVKSDSRPSALRASNPIKEGVVCAGIYVLLGTLASFAWAAHQLGGWRSFFQIVGIPETLGRVSAQFTVLAILLSIFAYLRHRSGTTGFILLDWKWWIFAIGLCAFPARPIVNWLGASLIYQYREYGRRALAVCGKRLLFRGSEF
jgi:hypothetical protein